MDLYCFVPLYISVMSIELLSGFRIGNDDDDDDNNNYSNFIHKINRLIN